MSKKSKISLPCCRICFSDSEYITIKKNAPPIKQAGAVQSLIKLHRTKNGPSEKLHFLSHLVAFFFTDSEHITLFEMPCVLSELEPLTADSVRYIQLGYM